MTPDYATLGTARMALRHSGAARGRGARRRRRRPLRAAASGRTVVRRSEVTRLTDAFRLQRIREGTYTLAETYGTKWTQAIDDDFCGWLRTHRERLHQQLGIADITIDRMIATRSRE